MAELLDPVETRADAILVSGFGSDGSRGPAGQVKAIPAGQFRLSLHNAPLDDPEYDAAAFDRAIEREYEWIKDGEEFTDQPSNARDGKALRSLIMTVRIGWISGAKLEKFVKVVGAEVALTAARNAKRRALTESDRVSLAMCEPELFTDNNTDPQLVGCYRKGQSTVRDLPIGGRLVSETRFIITILRNQNATYSP